jgi:hypothetical protein
VIFSLYALCPFPIVLTGEMVSFLSLATHITFSTLVSGASLGNENKIGLRILPNGWKNRWEK